MLLSQLLRVTAATLIATGVANANCVSPKAPRHLPDGNEATKEEMLAAHKTVKAYNDETIVYTDCLQKELDETIAKRGDSLKDKDKQSLEAKKDEKHNAAIDRVQKVAERFNEQLRVFNAKQAAAKKDEPAAEPAK